MDAVLVTLTAVSLGLTIAMGVVLLKVLREERHRSDARVALLVAAAAPQDPVQVPDESALTEFQPEPATSTDRPSLFARADAASPWPRRAAIAGGCVALVGAIAFTFGSRPAQPAPDGSRGGAPQAPLELLSLQDALQADALTISGVVQNPRGGTTVTRVVATASLLGSNGEIVADGRAALDFPSLAPGDESPFVIKIPVTGSVSRYRVGFRGPDGTVIAHVDRRSDATSARDVRNTGSVPPWVR